MNKVWIFGVILVLSIILSLIFFPKTISNSITGNVIELREITDSDSPTAGRAISGTAVVAEEEIGKEERSNSVVYAFIGILIAASALLAVFRNFKRSKSL